MKTGRPSAESISADKTLKLYPDLYHDILHEPSGGQVTADILDWLNRRAAR